MPDLTAKITPHPEVVATALPNEETVLLHLGTQAYYSLNETGAAIWRLAGEGLSLGEIARSLQERYAVSPEQAQRSVEELVQELAAEQLVSLSGS